MKYPYEYDTYSFFYIRHDTLWYHIYGLFRSFIGEIETNTMTCWIGFYGDIYCNSIDKVKGSRLYFHLNRDYFLYDIAKCIPFIQFAFRDLKYHIDIDWSRCKQHNGSPCGNGIWCETCLSGWRPPDCRRSCDPGYLGINCVNEYSFDWNGTTKAYKEADNICIILQKTPFNKTTAALSLKPVY